MAAKARITLGIALLVAALAVIGRAEPLISLLLISLAIFFIVWGKEQRKTESLVKGLPFGAHFLKLLDMIDSVVTPRDREYEEHVKSVITQYDFGNKNFIT